MALFDMNLSLSAGLSRSMNNLNTVNRLATSSLQRLETGQKFNHAADDPSSVVKASDLAGNMTLNEKAIDRNNGYIGDLDGIMSSQDEILSTLQEMKKSVNEMSTATEGKSAIAEKYNQFQSTIDTLANSVAFNGTAANGTSVSINVNAGGGDSASTNGSYSLVFDDITKSGLGVATSLATDGSNATSVLTEVDAAIDAIMIASAKVDAGKSVITGNNNIMSSALTGWAQSYNSLVQVNDAAESSILSSLQNRQSAIQASMGYQAQFSAGMSSISFMA